MNRKSDSHNPGNSSASHACVFVDYENLFWYVKQSATRPIRPKYVINSLLDAAVQYITQELQFAIASPMAYADFTLMDSGGNEIQQSLYLAGMEPRFVPASLQSNASEIQICIDVLELLQSETSPHAIFLITGDRLYLPLLSFCQQKQVRSQVITFRPPGITRTGEHSGLFIHAEKFLEQQPVQAYPEGSEGSMEDPASPRLAGLAMPPQSVTEITDDISLVALEIIEHFFGQYEEIYLTPLLRKLSEMLGGHDDPKFLVTKLKDAGAVWLEKRKGYPYNYTVLLINYDHPNVAALQESAEEERDHEEHEEYNHVRQDENSLHYD